MRFTQGLCCSRKRIARVAALSALVLVMGTAAAADAGSWVENPDGTAPHVAVVAAPVATGDAYATVQDVPLVIPEPGPPPTPGVLDNDNDPDGDMMTAMLVSGPTPSGTLTLNADGSFNFTPLAGFVGPVSFTYKVQAGGQDSNVVTVDIAVNPVPVPGPFVNTAPVAVNDAFAVDEGVAKSFTGNLTPAGAPALGRGMLSNDTDVDNDPLGVVTPLVTQPKRGTVTLLLDPTGTFPDGAFTYTPDPNFPDYNGSDSFKYNALDGFDPSNTATVNITINPVNDPPIAVDDPFYTVAEGGEFVANGLRQRAAGTKAAINGVLVNDTEVDVGDTLKAFLGTGPGERDSGRRPVHQRHVHIQNYRPGLLWEGHLHLQGYRRHCFAP